MASATLINRIVTEARDSVLDVLDTDQLERVPEEVETGALKAQLGRLASALYGELPSEPVPGTLRQRLLEFADS